MVVILCLAWLVLVLEGVTISGWVNLAHNQPLGSTQPRHPSMGSYNNYQWKLESNECNTVHCLMLYAESDWGQKKQSGFLLLCRIHFPWLFQTKWI